MAKKIVTSTEIENPKDMIGVRMECIVYPKNTIVVSRDKFGVYYLYINGKLKEQNEKYISFIPIIKKNSK